MVLLQSYSNEFKLPERKDNTPAKPGMVLLKVTEDSKDLLSSKEQSTSRAGIGKLMWHMQYSRPDVSQAVRDLARHMTRSDKSHMGAMLQCMKYIVCTKDAGLFLKPNRKWDGSDNFKFVIWAQSDLDYAKDTQTRRSISGYVVYVEEVPVMHRSAMQKTVTLSSCEAEPNAAVL